MSRTAIRVSILSSLFWWILRIWKNIFELNISEIFIRQFTINLIIYFFSIIFSINHGLKTLKNAHILYLILNFSWTRSWHGLTADRVCLLRLFHYVLSWSLELCATPTILFLEALHNTDSLIFLLFFFDTVTWFLCSVLFMRGIPLTYSHFFISSILNFYENSFLVGVLCFFLVLLYFDHRFTIHTFKYLDAILNLFSRNHVAY